MACRRPQAGIYFLPSFARDLSVESLDTGAKEEFVAAGDQPARIAPGGGSRIGDPLITVHHVHDLDQIRDRREVAAIERDHRRPQRRPKAIELQKGEIAPPPGGPDLFDFADNPAHALRAKA